MTADAKPENSYLRTSGPTLPPQEMYTDHESGMNGNVSVLPVSTGNTGLFEQFESEPELSAIFTGIMTPQQETERAIEIFKDIYKKYYQSLFAGLLQQKTEERVRRVIEQFWHHLAKSPVFQTIRHIGELRHFILTYDKVALNQLAELLTTDATFMRQFMGTFELCEYVKNVACFLPIWLDNSSAVALPREVLILVMKTRHDFSQELYRKAVAMESRQQGQESVGDDLPMLSGLYQQSNTYLPITNSK